MPELKPTYTLGECLTLVMKLNADELEVFIKLFKEEKHLYNTVDRTEIQDLINLQVQKIIHTRRKIRNYKNRF